MLYLLTMNMKKCGKMPKLWKATEIQLFEDRGWLKIKGYVWVEGKGGKGFIKPLAKL